MQNRKQNTVERIGLGARKRCTSGEASRCYGNSERSMESAPQLFMYCKETNGSYSKPRKYPEYLTLLKYLLETKGFISKYFS